MACACVSRRLWLLLHVQGTTARSTEAVACRPPSGDIEFSMLSAAMYTGVAVNAFVPLPQLLEDVTAFHKLMEMHNQHNMIQFLRPNLQFMKKLIGDCDDPTVLTGDSMNEEEAMREAIESNNQTIMPLLYLVKLYGDQLLPPIRRGGKGCCGSLETQARRIRKL